MAIFCLLQGLLVCDNLIAMGRKTENIDALLDLHGQIMVIDEKGHWVKFVVKQIPVSKSKPYGIDYSFTLHNKNGERVVGFDNAHSIKVKGKSELFNDHKHVYEKMTTYKYKDATTLLEDFWYEVDKILNKDIS